MKNLLLAAGRPLFTSCGMNRVEPNNERVLMENYGRGGQADFKAVTGAQGILGPGTELYQVPMWEQKADPQAVGITARDGGYFSIDPTYTYQAERGKDSNIVFNYKHIGLGQNVMDSIEDQVLNPLVLNAYREEARGYTTDSLLNNLGTFGNPQYLLTQKAAGHLGKWQASGGATSISLVPTARPYDGNPRVRSAGASEWFVQQRAPGAMRRIGAHP